MRINKITVKSMIIPISPKVIISEFFIPVESLFNLIFILDIDPVNNYNEYYTTYKEPLFGRNKYFFGVFVAQNGKISMQNFIYTFY